MRQDPARRAATWLALPLIVYTLAALIITWPLAARLTTHAAGAGYSDAYELIRHTWWTREALLDGQYPFRQSLLAYPQGFTSWLQFTHPLQYLFPALLAWVVPPVAALNLALLIVLVLDGWAAFVLGMHLSGRNVPAALLGGLIFMAFPTLQGHLSVAHLGILMLFPVPLLALCLWRLVREGAGWRTALAGGAAFALAALAYVSQIVFVLAPLIAFFLLYSLLWDRARLFPRGVLWRDQPWLKIAAMLILGGLLVLPFYLPVLLAGQEEISDLAEGGRVAYSADLLAFASPSPFGPLAEAAPDYARDVLGTNSAEGAAYLGIIAVALAGLALLRRRSAAGVWAGIALGSMLLALGPLLKWRGDPVILGVEDFRSYVALPWALLARLPLAEATRTPGRFNLSTALALSALASLGAGDLLARLRRGSLRWALAGVLGGLVLLEYQLFWPFVTVDARMPDYFRTLAQRDDVRAVLNIPVESNLVAKIGMYQQTLHHQPLIAGHALRRTVQDPALLRMLDQAASADPVDGLPGIPRMAAAFLLSEAGADRVIVHKQYYADPGAVVNHLRAVLGPPEFEDDRFAAFAVPRTGPPPDFTLAVAAGASGWSNPLRIEGAAWSFLGSAGEWAIYAPVDQYGDLVFMAAPYAAPRPVRVRLDGHLIDGWTAGAGEIRLPLRLARGFHTLRFEAVGGCTPYPFALTCLTAPPLTGQCAPAEPPLCLSVAFQPPRWEAAAVPLTPVDVRLAEGLRLRAYSADVLPDRSAVIVRLFWQAAGPLSARYALFVHLADPATAEPRAQADAFPLFATTEWEPGTRWQSEVRVDLPPDLPAGEVALNVGWFDPAADRRLAVRGDAPWAAAGIIHLEMIALGE